jgi:GNAT superfamily N-acetyltransferase
MKAIREARREDVPIILQLIHDLAVYEKEPDAVRNTPEGLEEALFGSDPRIFAHVAEDDGGVQGFALWFLNYSTWEGVHGIYLEDLYVRPEARGYARVEWSVLNWNEPSIDFYRSLGALPQEEWTTFRLSGAPLAGFAETGA